MKRQAKPWLTSTQKDEIWKRWRAAESVSEIGRALEREVGSVHRMLAKRGGIVPPPRKRTRTCNRNQLRALIFVQHQFRVRSSHEHADIFRSGGVNTPRGYSSVNNRTGHRAPFILPPL